MPWKLPQSPYKIEKEEEGKKELKEEEEEQAPPKFQL
jgi:hypothetical protein